MIVLAEGVCGRIARMFGVGGFEKVISCAQIETTYDFLDEDFVEVFLGSWSPGFFAWAVPLGDDLGRVGLGVNPELSASHPADHLQNFLSNHPALNGRYKENVMSLTIGAIPIGLKGRSYADGVVAVGDAVAQVKPISGGGVYLGTLCGRIAAQTIAEAFENGDTSAKRLSSYERAWKKEIGRELKFGMKIHNWIFTMKDEKISEILKLLNDEKILNVVNTYGDIDSPLSLAKKLLKELDFNILRMIKFLI
jgi:flavin-dependent dehydrogenase